MKTFSIINPFTNKIIDSYPYQSLDEATSLANELSETQKKWKDTTFNGKKELILELKNYLETNKDLFATTITTEMGKPVTEAKKEVKKCIDCCIFYSEMTTTIKKSIQGNNFIKEPLGVVLGVMPWNYPLWQLIRFLVPTLLAGNCCLIKPAYNVYKTARLLEMFFNQQKNKVCKVTIVDDSNVGHLIKNKNIHGVSLTGSVRAGKSVGAIATEQIKPCVLELGGSDPFIIFEDARLEPALSNGISARFSNCGQTCIAAKRFLIHESIYEKTITKFVDKAKEFIRYDDPMKPDTTIGPLARIDIKNTLENQLFQSNVSNSMIVYKDMPTNTSGNFFPAMIINGTNLDKNCPLLTEEIFGPIAVCQPFNSIEDAIEKANSTEYGLGASVWTLNEINKRRCSLEIDCGTIGINTAVHSRFDTPFGGRKNSGIGLELGIEGILSFTKHKSILTTKN